MDPAQWNTGKQLATVIYTYQMGLSENDMHTIVKIVRFAEVKVAEGQKLHSEFHHHAAERHVPICRHEGEL